MPLRVAKRFQKCLTSLTYKSIQTSDKYYYRIRYDIISETKKFPPEKND